MSAMNSFAVVLERNAHEYVRVCACVGNTCNDAAARVALMDLHLMNASKDVFEVNSVSRECT